jgi:hypothetical protein
MPGPGRAIESPGGIPAEILLQGTKTVLRDKSAELADKITEIKDHGRSMDIYAMRSMIITTVDAALGVIETDIAQDNLSAEVQNEIRQLTETLKDLYKGVETKLKEAEYSEASTLEIAKYALTGINSLLP